MRLLIVEDSPVMVTRILEVVALLPGIHPVSVSRTAAEAAATVESFHPRVVLLDCNLAGESGLIVLDAIRAAGQAANVIAWSSDPNPVIERTYLKRGASHFLDKSLQFRELESLLNNYSKSM